MDILKEIIQRCHRRYRKRETLRQRKTVLTPALYRILPYHIKVHCARRTPVILDDLAHADISFMPIGHAPENDRGPRDFGGDRFLKRQGTDDWLFRRWYTSWGIQIYTGIPSERNGAQWHDFEIKYEAICAAPDAVSTCIEALTKTTGTPLLTLTKSGGLRFSCRIPSYLHPDTDDSKFYIYKHKPTPENPNDRDVYFEIRGERGYSRWDGRYEILLGDLLNPPVIPKEVVFTPVDVLRAALHEPEPPGKRDQEPAVAAPLSIGSNQLDLAKEAFLKRLFVYIREEKGFHHWQPYGKDQNDTYVSLWEDQGIVWVRALTPDTGLPTRSTPITEIWNDTGITYPKSDTGITVSEKLLAIQEGRLSPLAIKRPSPVLHQQESTNKVYETCEKHAEQIRLALKQDARILGLVSSEAGILTDTTAETDILNSGATCLNIANRSLAEAAEERYEALNLPSFARWRARLYRWEQVKDIPVDERMANPFQHGNPCEDPERCRALEDKGGNALESICPQCAVYTECQERGYLSQPLALQQSEGQISPIYQLFLDPRRAQSLQQILDSEDETERICIIDESKISVDQLFLECRISKEVLAEWIANWHGNTLGNFAIALKNALETEIEPYGNLIGQVRSVIQAYQRLEAEMTHQMCHINVPFRVVARETVDPETGAALARYAIAFHGGASAYIPLDANAEAKLKAEGLPTFTLNAFTPNEDMRIPMQMTEAVALGILEVDTVEKIDAFPTVCKNPNWTYWHQLKCFFAHYTRDADAPMRWSGEYLSFWVPPQLHPNVKRLLFVSTMFTEEQLRQVFPDEKIEVVRPKPTAWVPGNKVFQLRTHHNPLHTILNYDVSWDDLSLSKIGERYLFAIRAEIDRDPSVKHAVFINKPITDKFADIAEKENVCFVANFKAFADADKNLKTAQVVWIVGMPHWAQRTIWWQAQMLYGNDAVPLNYNGEIESGGYEDDRIQAVHDQSVAGQLAQIVGRAGLNRWTGKTVVLLTSFALPDITDRPETILFDWEDFEVAGGLHRLEDTIRTRERFEAERETITAETSRNEVERILGCSARQANFILKRLRGGNIPRISIREQIFFLLAAGRERTMSSFVAAIDSSPQTISNELKRLIDAGEIVRVRRGVYALPEA